MSAERPIKASFELVTAAGGALGAIATLALRFDATESCERFFEAAELRVILPGERSLGSLGGIDHGVIARLDRTTVLLFPHGSPLVVSKIGAWLESIGVVRNREGFDPQARFPEATGLIEACMLETLARAASPLSIDILLRQPGLWASGSAKPTSEHDRALDRLVEPPTVVCVGYANVGKSTLVNALARRRVAIVADEPGTTRDHIGVLLDLAGLVVRWVDTPGLRKKGGEAMGKIERSAQESARQVVERAELIVCCGDAESGFADLHEVGASAQAGVLRCATRADIGPVPSADLSTAALASEGLSGLAAEVRESLVSERELRSSRPWRFHPLLRAAGGC